MTPSVFLEQGLLEMQINAPREVVLKLVAYLELMAKWNRVYNLTAVRNPLDMVTLHVLDSLSVLPYVQAKTLLDVGSGAGLPGIVLAIMRPDLQVTTVDTVQKKATFMRQVKGELGLENLSVQHARVENMSAEVKFDAIISRAFSEISLFIQLTQHLIAEKGQWLAMKGQTPTQELESLPYQPSQIIPLTVAGLNAERHLVVFENHS